MALNKYQITLKGADYDDLTGNAQEVTFWVTGPYPEAKKDGAVRKKAGGVQDDSASWRWAFTLKTLFHLERGNFVGNDFSRFLTLMRSVVARRFKAITAAKGLQIAGEDHAKTFLQELLEPGPIMVVVTDVKLSYGDDNTVSADLKLEARSRGL